MSLILLLFDVTTGTGKSFILKILQDVMEKLRKIDKIAFTASTGVAACNIRGLTIHSWAGLGIYIDYCYINITKLVYSREETWRYVRNNNSS